MNNATKQYRELSEEEKKQLSDALLNRKPEFSEDGFYTLLNRAPHGIYAIRGHLKNGQMAMQFYRSAEEALAHADVIQKFKGPVTACYYNSNPHPEEVSKPDEFRLFVEIMDSIYNNETYNKPKKAKPIVNESAFADLEKKCAELELTTA